jgi:hypothetical protein
VKKQQDPAEPTNWLVISDSQDISRIKARSGLPTIYLDFLTRFSPVRVIIRARTFYNPFWLFGAGELVEAQNGYSFNPIDVSFRRIGVAAYIDHDGARQNQDNVLTDGDVDTVAVGPGEVLLRDGRDLATVPSKGIFIIE